MDELQLIKSFRAPAPQASDETRRHAREQLTARFDGRSRFGFSLLDRRRVLIWVAAALLAGLLAGSALAFGGRFLDFVRGEPAPKPVQRQFAFDFGPKQSVTRYFDFPNVDKSRIHGVLAFQTRYGPVALWAAPTTGGHGVCVLVRRLRPRNLLEKLWSGYAGCRKKGVPGGGALVAAVQATEGTTNGQPEHDPSFAFGIAAKDVVRVDVHLTDGSVHRASVHEGFFGVGVPPGSSLAFAVGLDAKGRKIGTYRPAAAPPPASSVPAPPRRTGPYQRVFDAVNAGHRVIFAAAPATGGGLCTQQAYSGHHAEGSCLRRSRKPLQLLGIGENQIGPPEWGFLIGRARPAAAAVRLRFEDGTSTPLRMTRDRFFLVFLGRRRTIPGHRALELVAYDRAGSLLGTLKLNHLPGR